MLLFFFLSDFLYKRICCGYSFELLRQLDVVQMGTHNICLYTEIDKKYTGCKLKITDLLDYALIGVCSLIRLNTVFHFDRVTLNITFMLPYLLYLP